MKTRRGESLGGTSSGFPGMAAQPLTTATASAEPSAIPTQQQRLLGQLKTAMLNLNKKFGNNVTTEVLNQMVGSLIFDQEELKHQSWRPEYSDVKIDVDLSNPPIEIIIKTEETGKDATKTTIPPIPAWFDFDKVSEIENAHFGPLFSMDEERWKTYMSMRNDLIRIYDDFAIVSDSSFMSASEIRQRMHPKDDAAQIFELWKFLSQHKVINRGQVEEDAMNGVVRDTVQAIGSQDVKQRKNLTNFTLTKCSSCGRECKFFCYKSIPPPPQSPEPTTGGDDLMPIDTPDIPMPSDEVKEDVEMKQEEIEDEKFFCHDCTPPFFEKIPLRLFIDESTRDRIVHGEFEEVTKDDLRSFIVVQSKAEEVVEEKIEEMKEKEMVDKIILSVLGGKKTGPVVSKWDSYSTITASSVTEPAAQANNPLEILDPMIQEALSGAGQKIRGSVLIEQQVRNLIIGPPEQTRRVEETVPSCHPVSVDRAFELITEIFTLVHDTLKEPIPKEVVNSTLFTHAKKTDAYHFGVLSLVYRVVAACESIKRRHLTSRIDLEKLESKISQRVSVKKEFLLFLKSKGPAGAPPQSPRAKVEGYNGSSIFHPEVAKTDRLVLSSKNPVQVNLVAL
jgi:hypothetical protein